jgi:hypothetical protein
LQAKVLLEVGGDGGGDGECLEHDGGGAQVARGQSAAGSTAARSQQERKRGPHGGDGDGDDYYVSKNIERVDRGSTYWW